MSFRNIRDEGIQKVATAAERLLLFPPDGTVVEQLDTHTLYIYDQPSNAWIAVAGGGGGGGNAFGIIQADSGTSPTADTTTDTLNLISDNPTNYSFTGDALTDTITFSAPGLLPKSTFEDYNLVQKEPTGFPNRTDSTTSFSNATRIFTIQPATTSFDVYIRGNKYTKTTSQTTTIPNLSGNHYIYFDINGNLQNTQTADPTLFTDNALVGIIYWNTDTSTQTYYGEERHGLVMDGATHSYLHTVFGARYLSGLGLLGFTIGSGSANADAQFTSDAGSLRDEDILLTPAAQSQIPILYRQGTLWRKKTADSYPVIYSGTAGYTGANGRLPYNLLSGGTWSLSEVPNNNFVLVHFFGTNDVNNPVVGIQGINTYTSISNARAGANTEIASLTGLPFAEFVPIGTVIFETSNSYSNTPKARVRQTDTGDNYVDFRGSSGITISPGSISLDLNDLTDVNITSPSNNQVLTYDSATNTWVNATNGNGTVTSVGLSLPTEFTVTGSPVTSSGTLTATFANQNANLVFAGPSSGAAATPSFRSLTATDIPSLPYVSTTLTSGNILVGNASNAATSVTMSGDATISNTGALTVANNAITDAKFRQSAGLSVIGRSVNTTGNVADITAGSDFNILRRSGTTLGFGSIDLSQSGAVGTSRLGYSNLAQGSARSVLGVTGNATADVASIQGTADQVLRVDSAGTALSFGQIATGGIANDAVTYAKIQNVTNQRILGRNSAGSGDVEETTTSQVLDWIGSTQGQILYRGASGWAVLSPGTSGQVLQTNGAAADPSWATVSTGGITSLNSQTGATQTFANDTNVTITSATNTHTLGWSGTLSNARGGTGTGTYATGDILYASATNTLSKLTIGSTGQVLTVSGGVPTWAAVSGTGTVTSVGLSLPSIFTVSGSPVTTSGTLTGTLANQTANTVFAGPSSGGAAAPTFRSLVASDIPSLPYISTTLNSGQIIVGNASNVATAVTMSSDATISNTGALTIANNAVTDAKFRQSAALSVVGRASNTSGNVADITASLDYEVFRRSGTSIGFGSIDLSQSAAVGSSRLGFTNLDQGSARSVLGVAGNATANFASIQGTTDQVLRVDSAGTALGFGQVATGGIANDAVTYAKIQNVTNQRVLGRNSAGSGDVEETTASQVLDWIGSTQGQILYRGASGWAVLAPGTSGQLLQTNGTGADPSWVTASGGGGITSLNSQTGASQTFSNDTNVTITSSSNVHTLGWSGTLSNARGGTGTGTYTTGDILYASATNTLSKLPIGSSGQVLTVSSGVPTWAAAGGGSVTAGTNIQNVSGTISALTKTVSDSSMTGFKNNYAPTGWGTDVSVLRLSASDFIFLTGLSAGADNQRVEIRNVGTVSIGLSTKDTASSASNRFDFGDSDYIIFPDRSVTVVYDATLSRWRLLSTEMFNEESKYLFRWFSDCMNAIPIGPTTNEWGVWTGTGSVASRSVTAQSNYYNRQGIVRIAHSTTVGNRHSWYQTNNNGQAFQFSTGKNATYGWTEFAVNLTTLSDSTNRYYFQAGFFDSVTGNPIDAAMVTYRDDENSGKFILRAVNNMTVTDGNSNITVAADTWYRLKLIVYPNNTSRLFIDGNLEANITTGLPSLRDTGWGISIRKIAGTLDRSIDIDYMGQGMAKGGLY